MEVRATAKYVRMSPRKVRLVTNLIKGRTIDEARTQLAFLPKAASIPVLKVLNSAAANAVNNFKLDEASLRIAAAMADQGPALKRWRARAMGRAAPIKKRTSHITVIVTDGKSAPAAPKKGEKAPEEKTEKSEKKPTAKKTTAKSAKGGSASGGKEAAK